MLPQSKGRQISRHRFGIVTLVLTRSFIAACLLCCVNQTMLANPPKPPVTPDEIQPKLEPMDGATRMVTLGNWAGYPHLKKRCVELARTLWQTDPNTVRKVALDSSAPTAARSLCFDLLRESKDTSVKLDTLAADRALTSHITAYELVHNREMVDLHIAWLRYRAIRSEMPESEFFISVYLAESRHRLAVEDMWMQSGESSIPAIRAVLEKGSQLPASAKTSLREMLEKATRKK